MIPWPSPAVPALPGRGLPLRLFDTATGSLQECTPPAGSPARLYVCGITPYDAAHLGHAATYVAFDLLVRQWRDSGLPVRYAQNVTDVDDPLLERANATGQDWQELATREVARFGDDMSALGVLAPDFFPGAVESIPLVVDAVRQFLQAGQAYRVPTPEASEPGAQDVYFDLSCDQPPGAISHLTDEELLTVFAERGGDPQRAGKRHPLDPLLWRVRREGEPWWPAEELGAGRPGWHIECSTIATHHLGMTFDVQGGGSDLVFPHHEMSAAHARVLTGKEPFARRYAHAGMVRLAGEKMSKSRGNLVFVHALREQGVDPAAIRLAILAHPYRHDWDWDQDVLHAAEQRLQRWRAAVSIPTGAAAEQTLSAVRARLADDLDAPGALAAIDAWADAQLAHDGDQPGAPGLIARTADALLGVRL